MGAVSPAGSRGQAPGQGAKPPEAETLLAFGHSTDTANLLCFPKFGNLKIRFCGCFCPKKFDRPQFVTVYCEYYY